MGATFRFDLIRRACPLRAEEAVAVVQDIGRRLLRVEPDDEGCVTFPTLASLLVTDAGDVRWCVGERAESGQCTARLAHLLMRLYEAPIRQLPVHLLHVIVWATEEGGVRAPAEFLRGLDEFGPADNTSTIRGLLSRWQATSSEADRLAARDEYEIDLDGYCPRTPPEEPFGRDDDGEMAARATLIAEPVTAGSAGRAWQLALPAVAALVSVALASPGLLQKTFWSAPIGPPVAGASDVPVPAPARALDWAVGRDLTVALERRPVATTPVARPAAQAPAASPSAATEKSGAATRLGRLVSGSGRHKVQAFPRPSGR
jgi:hypothetical protein